MGRGAGLFRFPRLTPSPTPMPSRYASLDSGKEVEPSDSSLSSSLEDWCGIDGEGWWVGLKKKGLFVNMRIKINSLLGIQM